MSLALKAEIDLDGSGFERTTHKVEHLASHMASHVGDELRGLALQAFGIYGIEQAFERTAEMAKELVNQSKRLGVGVEELQVLKQAAKDGGTEIELLAKKFEELDVNRQKALGNSQEAPKLLARFAQLGISPDDLRQRTAGQLFLGPLRQAANTMNQEDLGPILKDILGKGFGQVIPVLKTDFEELEKTMRKLGVVMDTETAVKVKRIGDEFELLSKIIVVTVGPALVRFAEWVLNFISKSPLVEGVDFLFRRHGELGKLPGFEGPGGSFTAKERADQAVHALETFRQSQIRGESFADYRDTRNMFADTQYFSLRGPRTGIFADDKSTNAKEELKYLNSLIQPAADATNHAAQGAGEDMKRFQDSLEEMRKQIEREVNELKNPRPPTFEPEPTPEARRHRGLPSGDALVRVGNFLGASRNSLQSLGERQLGVLQRIESNTRRSPLAQSQQVVSLVRQALRFGIPPI